jgi:hypothetical protein
MIGTLSLFFGFFEYHKFYRSSAEPRNEWEVGSYAVGRRLVPVWIISGAGLMLVGILVLILGA